MRINLIATAAIVCCPLTSFVHATHGTKRRQDFSNLQPLSQSGYVVPVQGSETCNTAGFCTTALPLPPQDKTLTYLTLARGISTYSCIGRKPTDIPVFLAQDTTLWDAAPLLPQLPNEDYFHSLVTKFREFDYTSLKNSSLTCIGNIESINSQTEVEISNMAPFHIHIQNLVNAPFDSDINLQWAHSTSLDLAWDIYRVETVDGAPPSTCQQHNELIKLDYAAEYWFYYGKEMSV